MEMQEGELATLEAIFNESFVRLGERSFSFDFASTFYKFTFHFEIEYSENYPSEPLARLEVTSQDSHGELASMVQAKLRQIELEMVNPDLPYVYSLASAIDDEQFQIQDIGAQTRQLQEQAAENAEEDEDAVVIKVNHGQLPGKPVTDDNYRAWWEEYRSSNNIQLLDDADWTKVDVSKEMGPNCTGYEFFRRKQDEK